jgi:hypothetical protein
MCRRLTPRKQRWNRGGIFAVAALTRSRLTKSGRRHFEVLGHGSDASVHFIGEGHIEVLHSRRLRRLILPHLGFVLATDATALRKGGSSYPTPSFDLDEQSSDDETAFRVRH